MERRSWPWKKKLSDKTAVDKPVPTSGSVNTSLSSVASLGDQENYKNTNYVQISMDSYNHFSKIEDQVGMLKNQVKTLEDEVKDLKEKLSAAHSEVIAKDNLAIQHAKVAEEAVSGWERADAEALALKHQLDSVSLLKLAAEDRASHLDGALKECMRQIRNVKEESEQKLHEVVLSKTKQWDKIKHELEAKITELGHGLLRADAENAALSRSLQEHSNKIMKINYEKSEAEAEIELLRGSIKSAEKEISSLKYDLHLASKELDIRNEETKMSLRSAEVSNKQYVESVNKVSKLEAECQRLRGLVRKKLPGPAALAQMKLEVESLGRDFYEPQIRKTSVKNTKPHVSPQPDTSIEHLRDHKDTEFLSRRLLAMEEETKMLKEALATRNSELVASKDVCAKTAASIKSLEAQIQALQQQRDSPKSHFGNVAEGKSHFGNVAEGSSQNASNSHIDASVSENGIDEEQSSTPLFSETSHSRSNKSIENSGKPQNPCHLELMDDFLEMERLACSSIDGDITFSDCMDKGTIVESKMYKHDLSVSSYMEGATHRCPSEDLEQLKLKKDKIAMDLARCSQEFESTKLQLQEKDRVIAELRIQLASSEKSYCLVETQLKCVTVSYKSLESRAQKLDDELNKLREKAGTVEKDLLQERQFHQGELAKCKDVEECIQRNEKCLMCSVSPLGGFHVITKQEREMAATEKLVECQETMYLLGRQLQALCPRSESIGSRHSEAFDKPSHSDSDPKVIKCNHAKTEYGIAFTDVLVESDVDADLLVQSPSHPNESPSSSSSSGGSSHFISAKRKQHSALSIK